MSVSYSHSILEEVEKEFAKFVENKQNEIKQVNERIQNLHAKARKIEFELTNVAYVFEDEKKRFSSLTSTPSVSGVIIPPSIAKIVKSFHSKMRKVKKAVKSAVKATPKTAKSVKKVVKTKKK